MVGSRPSAPWSMIASGLLTVVALFGFVWTFLDPDLLDLGGWVSPAGLCLFAAVAGGFWFLYAAARHRPAS
ncbi:MAG: hypothetical protein ACFCGT_11845 [Sandaracinaceae bacterium]